MSQSALIALLSILLFTGGLFGGGSKSRTPDESPPPTVQAEMGDVQERGVVRANTVAVHEQPGSRTVIAHLVRGDELTVLEQTDGWYRVRLANGFIGYVNTFAVSTSATSPPVIRRGDYEVVAYYLTDSRRPSMPSLTENIDVISTVIPWMWLLTETGEIIDDFDARDVSQALTFAGTNGRRGKALVHNLRQTEFDPNLAHALLSSATARARAIDNLARQLTSWELSGVHIDFENVLPQDRQNLNLFMKELHERLHPEGFEISIAVPAKTQDRLSDSWHGGYDYATISRYVDKMMIMTYDEHWRGGPPGPVASIGWVERVVRFALSVGVPSEKIMLGVPGYGYDWPRDGGRGRAVTYAEAMALASQHGARILWDDTAKVPYFQYGNREIWFENRSSLSYKLDLVTRYDLGGISLWRLGQEDPGIWSVLRQKLG